MVEPKTRAMMQSAMHATCRCFEACEGREPVLPVWIIENATGQSAVIATPFCNDDEQAAAFAKVREIMHEMNAVRYVFVSEGYAMLATLAETTTIDSVKDHPRRMEVIGVLGEDLTGTLHLSRRVVRPEDGGMPTLDPPEYRHGPRPLGMGPMLPGKSEPQSRSLH